jgi:ubiquinone biosynthesis protein UbiJ
MATVSEKVRGTFSTAKAQLAGLEKKAVKQVEILEKRAKESLGEVRGQIDSVPQQLKGTWETVVGRVRGALDFASNDDLKKLQSKVENLSKQVEKLVRGDKIKAAADSKVKAAPNGKKS